MNYSKIITCFVINATVLFSQKSPDVNDVSTSTSINHKATTFGVREVQVDGNLKETTNGTDQYSSPDVVESSTSTPINHKATTLGIPENEVGGNLNETTEQTDQYSSTTAEISQESRQTKSLWYLFIIIPLIIFIAACTGYVTWKHLHERKRSSE
ncbi:unnamed protein product [Schistosoma curassoni]|uniref:Type VII secretion protein EssA n=1 Tax=Schistosoma curassoni TaxID=6186 RepID=A0A183JTF7_9TREM|nr:unnamed protein product [Schistosoma curassoni]